MIKTDAAVTARVEFTGAGTDGISAHGAFEIGAGTGIWNVKGQIGGYNGPGTTTTPNPQIRLKRGYTYFFDFADNNNATKLSFKTGASEAAAEKMSLSSGGNLTCLLYTSPSPRDRQKSPKPSSA